MPSSRSINSRKRRTSRNRRFNSESLEDRRMLAGLTVNSVLDNVAADAELTLREAISLVNSAGDANAAFGRSLTTEEQAQVDVSDPFGTNDTVSFGQVAFAAPQSIVLSGTELSVTNSVKISGPNSTLVISGNDASRILNVDDGDLNNQISVELTSLTLNNGRAADGAIGGSGPSASAGSAGDSGGAIRNTEDLTIRVSTVTNNRAGNGGLGGSDGISGHGGGIGGDGGGIFNSGTLNVIRSTVSGNFAGTGGDGGGAQTNGGAGGIGGDGGGIASTGTLTVTASTISGNVAGAGGIGGGTANVGGDGGDGGDGGGVFGFGDVGVANSTVSGNQAGAGGAGGDASFGGAGGAGGDGGGIFSASLLTLANGTVHGNDAGVGGNGGSGLTGPNDGPHGSIGDGGGLKQGGTSNVSHAIVAGSTVGADVSGSGTLFGSYNLVQDGSDGLSDTLTGDPVLGTLADNGAATQTHALLTGSPAIDAGDSVAVAGMNGVPSFDQRKLVGVCDGNQCTAISVPRIQNGRIDIGAFESTPLVVNSTADLDDGDMTNGSTTLREAIKLANLGTGADTITFDASLSDATITLAGTELAITDTVAIDASALASNVTIDGNAQSRVLRFAAPTGDLRIDSLNIQNGNASSSVGDEGGGIWFQSTGAIDIAGSSISGNKTNDLPSGSGHGGGISAQNAITIDLVNSSVLNNRADGYGRGGGIRGGTGAVTITGSTLAGNLAYQGGGVLTTSGAVNLVNSTVSGNHVQRSFARGGGFRTNSGNVTIESSTITGNTTASRSFGGGFSAGVGSAGVNVVINNSIVAGNQTTFNYNPDLEVVGTITASYSLIGNAKDTSLTEAPVGSPDANGNLIGGPTNGVIDPQLFGLADNGGPTQTHALQSGSPAHDAGDPNFDPSGFAPTLDSDQRGAGFDRVQAAGLDIGAFENQTPQIGDGSSTATFSLIEDTTTVTNLQSNDDLDSEGSGLGYALTASNNGGDDNLLFLVDPSTGELSFVAAPDYENPQDIGGTAGDNVYEVQVSVTDSLGATGTQDITVEVKPSANPEFLGTNNADTIDVTETATTIDVNLNGQVTSYQLADISSLTVRGRGGNDHVRRLGGTSFTVTAFGGNGADRMDGNAAVDIFFGGKGRDLIRGNGGDDIIGGGDGDDTLRGGNGNDTINGNKGADRIFGENGNDILRGKEDNDIVIGGNGNDLVSGEAGNDVLIGGLGVDQILGGTGGDLLIGGSTSIDNDSAMLGMVMAEWNSTNSYNARVNNLTDGSGTPGGGANGTLYLPSVVFGDTDDDQLSGSTARDYFWALQSEILDLATNEIFV